MDVHSPPLPQGSVVQASIIDQSESRQHTGMLRRNSAQSIFTSIFSSLTVLSYTSSLYLSFFCSSNLLSLSKLSAEVTWIYKGKGQGFRSGIQPVCARLCKTWHDWLSQLLPQCAGCSPHGIEFNATIFYARLCKEEDNVCCCSPLLDVFCICWLPQRGRSGCKIYLGQSYYFQALFPVSAF